MFYIKILSKIANNFCFTFRGPLTKQVLLEEETYNGPLGNCQKARQNVRQDVRQNVQQDVRQKARQEIDVRKCLSAIRKRTLCHTLQLNVGKSKKLLLVTKG